MVRARTSPCGCPGHWPEGRKRPKRILHTIPPSTGARPSGKLRGMGTAFRKVGVVGLGTMGAGIAEVLARGGLHVVGIEINDEALARGRGHLEGSTGRAVK